MGKMRLALFASGAGSNALKIIAHLKGNDSIEVGFVLSNKKDAPIVTAAQALNVPTHVYANHQVEDGSFLTELCKTENIDFIVLAGYLRLVPKSFIEKYPNKIINLHPSLLPKYGGKGMHGENVHRAVLENQEKETGISIHFIDEEFDKGQMIAQFYCSVEASDTIESVKKKIQYLEHSYFPIVIEKTILSVKND